MIYPIFDINELNEFEFKSLIINIFYFLDYEIDITRDSEYDYDLEKENLFIILKIKYNSNNEFVTLNEVLDFKKK
jgi:hypothetical protein